MRWPWQKKKPPAPRDARVWNDDWQIGDTAECVIDFDEWHDCVDPWERIPKGTMLTVVGFSDQVNSKANVRAYMLHFKERGNAWSTTAFRKVRSVSAEQSEVVQRILTAKPGVDRVRETTSVRPPEAHTAPPPAKPHTD